MIRHQKRGLSDPWWRRNNSSCFGIVVHLWCPHVCSKSLQNVLQKHEFINLKGENLQAQSDSCADHPHQGFLCIRFYHSLTYIWFHGSSRHRTEPIPRPKCRCSIYRQEKVGREFSIQFGRVLKRGK